jgi:hypothetical protein
LELTGRLKKEMQMEDSAFDVEDHIAENVTPAMEENADVSYNSLDEDLVAELDDLTLDNGTGTTR